MCNFVSYSHYCYLHKKSDCMAWFSLWGRGCMFIEDLVTSVYKTFSGILMKDYIWRSLPLLKPALHIPQWWNVAQLYRS